jgi:hypothetical protein
MINIIENLTSVFYDIIRDNCSEELNDLSWNVIYMDLKDNNFRELSNSLDFIEYRNLLI